ncbi:MAG: 4Fe-4S ferredoxin [Acidobacteria bacterium]|nr:MAG: 4Fe-4S ferredoxin [Acidobacteriota bacterium]
MAGPARGKVEVDQDECKGCGLCAESCPAKVLELSTELNRYGVHPMRYVGEGCSGCGVCYMVCPEPGAITVYRLTAQESEARDATTL